MTFSANLSILFPELPFAERPRAAGAAGFDRVECWWPFPDAAPSDPEIAAFLTSLREASVELTGLNFFAGDMAAGDRGVLSHPDATGSFAANAQVVRRIADETGCRHFNALYGQRLPGINAAVQDDTALRNLEVAAAALDDHGGTILLEPLTRGENGDYPLLSPDDVVAVMERSGIPSVRLLFDTYHLHNNGFDVVAELGRQAGHVGHIQVADSPGRGQPGTGTIDFAAFLSQADAVGYDGVIGCEYRPQGATADSFGWLPEVTQR